MHKHHIIPKSRGGTDDDWNMRELSSYDHAYEHALDYVLFDHAPRFDFRHEAWPLLPEDLKEAVRNKLRQWNQRTWIGRSHTLESREKISKGMSQYVAIHGAATHTEEAKDRIRKAFKGVPRPKLKCPHCGLEGGIGNMQRWHFDNCRVKLT